MTARGHLDLAVVSAAAAQREPGGVPLLREPLVALVPAGGAPRAAAVARDAGVAARPLADAPVRELRLIRAPGTRRTPVERELEEDLREAARGGPPADP
jgi:hypothetical protein